MRIALFGASGFVGRHLALHSARMGHSIIGLGRHMPDDWPKNIAWLNCDLSDSASVHVPCGTDAVFFLAQSAYYHNFPHHADDLFAVNALGAARAAKAALEAGSFFFATPRRGAYTLLHFYLFLKTHLQQDVHRMR